MTFITNACSRAVEELADEFNLSTEERNELLPSGSQALFNNRVGWARSYLKQASLLASPKRGFFTITSKGNELLATNLEKIDISVLEQFPEFIEFKNRKKEKTKLNHSQKKQLPKIQHKHPKMHLHLHTSNYAPLLKQR